MEKMEHLEGDVIRKMEVIAGIKADIVGECRNTLKNLSPELGLGVHAIENIVTNVAKEILKDPPKGHEENPRVLRAKAIDIINDAFAGNYNRQKIMEQVTNSLNAKLSV